MLYVFVDVMYCCVYFNIEVTRTGVLDNRLVRRHSCVQVYSGIYLERRYAVPAAGTRYLIS